MDLLKRSQERRRVALFALVLMVILLLATAYMVESSRSATDAAIEAVSEVYLRELSDQVTAHFNTGIENKFCQVETVGTSLELAHPADIEQAEGLLAAQKSNDDYEYLALHATDGRYYTCEGEAGAPLGATVKALAADASPGDAGREVAIVDGAIVLVDAIDPVPCGPVAFDAVVAGFDASLLSDRLNLDLFEGDSRSSIITADGTCIIGCESEGLRDGGNVFDALEAYAVLDDGYTMDEVRERVAAGEACLVPYSYGSQHEYLYFRPLDETGWYLCTAMPYGVVDDDIAALTGALMQNAIIMGGVLALLAAIMFFAYYRLVKRNTKLLAEEKARAEEASLRAQRASRAKSEFLSRMSHEIRTPMNGIMGMTSIALENIGDDAKVRDSLNKAMETSRHLRDLINDILDMSKIESGKVEIRCEPFDFGSFVGSLTTVFETQAVQEGLCYETVLRGPLPRRLVGDALHLKEVVYNLVGNAFKFTPRGGSITVLIERILDAPLDAASAQAGREDAACLECGRALWVRFAVSDTGCGISPEHFDRIFSSFEQAEASTASEYGGTGLGLAITKRFVEMMGGSIRLSSAVGQGSTFTVELPLAFAVDGDPANEEMLSNPSDCPARQGIAKRGPYDFADVRILVAEDNELNREIAVEVLGMVGARVDAAATGAEAVRRFSESFPGTFDVILMDVQMPEMDGLEATRAIRALDRPDARGVPILAMTANAFVEDEEKSRLSGMDGHLSKPLDIQLVYATIEGLLQKTRGEGGPAEG